MIPKKKLIKKKKKPRKMLIMLKILLIRELMTPITRLKILKINQLMK